MSHPSDSASSRSRLDYVDNLRVFLVALVICHHLTVAFGAPGGWYYIITQPSDALSLVAFVMFVAVNQAFFMSLLFFVAAYFTPISMDSKGVRRFIRERLMRLGIPLGVYYFFLNPTVVYLVSRFRGTAQAGYFTFMAGRGIYHWGWGPLWFVLSLIIFTFVYLAVAAWRQRRDRPAVILPFPNDRQITAFIIGIGVFTFLLRAVVPLGVRFLGLEIGYFPLYIAFFIFGILACRGAWLEQLDLRQTRRWFYIAAALIIALPLMLVLGGALRGEEEVFRGGFTAQSLAYSLWEPFLCVGISMKLLTVFRARLNAAPRPARLLRKSAYGAYIIHPFFVITGTYLVRNWQAPPAIVVLTIGLPVVAACFFTANLLRQAPLARSIL